MRELSDARDFIASRKAAGARRVVFVSGVFNVLHPGHLRLLKFAAEQGDLLLVGVLSNDLAPHAVVDEGDRVSSLDGVSYADLAFVLRDSAAEAIRQLRPEVVVKGREWAETRNPEAEALGEYGGQLRFSSGDVSFSSLQLIREEFARKESFALRESNGYLHRHGIDSASLRNALLSMRDLKVLVVGDTIVDEYILCETLGMSQEDPVVVVRPITTRRFVGGAGVVSLHARGLGASVRFLSMLGDDEPGAYVRDELARSGVASEFLLDATRPTTVKQRFMASNKKLLRVSYLREHAIVDALVEEFFGRFERLAADADLVIFSDFNYGLLPEPARRRALELCVAHGIRTVADCQSSSQVGDISRYAAVDLVTPTEREARLALHDNESGLVVLADRLQKKMGVKELLITLGSEGVLIHHPAPAHFDTDRLPALNPNPKDVVGAGDSLLVGSSLALAAGRDIWTAAYVGSLCAAYQVAQLGNQPALIEELLGILKRELA